MYNEKWLESLKDTDFVMYQKLKRDKILEESKHWYEKVTKKTLSLGKLIFLPYLCRTNIRVSIFERIGILYFFVAKKTEKKRELYTLMLWFIIIRHSEASQKP